MSENKIKFPVKLASNNPQSFGIVDATEISGHRSVDTLSDLYSISDPMLSILKDGSDAIGQEWFVASEDCKYRLDNWGNRKSIAGWTRLPKQELIDDKQSTSEKDHPDGYAGLDSNGKVPIEKTYGTTATVVEVETYESLPVTGLSGVIYYVSNTGAQYKWSGSAYIDITDGADNAKKNETSIFDCSNGTSTKYYSSLSNAINVVPPAYRTSNRIISYLSTENSTTSAVNYQYHGIDSTTWTDLTKWERIPNQTDLAELRSDLSEATLLCTGKIKNTYTSNTLNLNNTIHAYVPKGQILVKISVDKPISSGPMYCYYKINENPEKYLGQISEQFLEKTINLDEASKLSIRYGLVYSMGYTVVTELQTDSFADSIAHIDNSVKNISDFINNKVVTYKEIEPTEEKEGCIDNVGSFKSSSALKVKYYPVNIDRIYKVTTNVFESGLYPFHFYNENGLYIGHTGEQNLIANEVFLDVPVGSVIVAVNAKIASTIKLLEDYGDNFVKLQNEIDSIKVSLTKSNYIPISSTAIGFIKSDGSVSTYFPYFSIDYYNIEDSSLEYLCSSKISGDGVFIVHFYDQAANYLGHAPARDSNVENYEIPEIPAETSVIAINRFNSGTSQLMSKSLENDSIPDKIAKLENRLTLNRKILVGFGDSITQLKDSNNNSYLDYISQNTGITAYNAAVGGSILTVGEECVFIEILTTPTSSGIVKVKGAVTTVSFTAEIGDSVETLASKLYEAYRTVSTMLARSVIGAEVCVKNWSGFTIPIQTDTISVETNTGVEIHVRKNAFGMFETFNSTYLAYRNLDILPMVYGLTTGDWRCQKLAAQYLEDNSIVGFISKINTLESLNVTDLDVVTIAGGTNNYDNTDFGDISSHYTKVAGGMKEIGNMLLSANKDLKVCFFTPIPRYFGNDISNWDDTKWGGVYEVYANGVLIRSNAMPMLVEAITNTAKQMCMPVYDMYYSMGWNKWNFSQFFNNNDGTHPYKGLKWMGDKMTKYILNLL